MTADIPANEFNIINNYDQTLSEEARLRPLRMAVLQLHKVFTMSYLQRLLALKIQKLIS